ncbi:MAG: pilus assembly protein CpaB [Blastococcus sp.]|jgi:pilus assembly protein CpaB|nr:pilus assembly protein CpaB [Blastococcus sp.]
MRRFRRPRSPLHLARRIAAVLLAACAIVLALRPSPALPADPRPVVVGVAVAATDLPAGTVLSGRQLTVAQLPPSAVPSGTAPEPAPLIGRVLAGSVRAGEPLTDVRLVGSGLTRLLPEGQVAAPVRLADLAVAALVHTGDRVDVLATPHDAARADVVAANALVLATDGSPRDASADPGGGLLLLAVDGTTAGRLAAAAASATLTVTLPGR